MIEFRLFISAFYQRVIIALDVPEIAKNCYRRNLPVWRVKIGDNANCTTEAERYLGNIALLKNSLEPLRDKATIFDPSDLFCSGRQCGEIDPANYLYLSDGNHLNEYGIQSLGQSMAKVVEDRK